MAYGAVSRRLACGNSPVGPAARVAQGSPASIELPFCNADTLRKLLTTNGQPALEAVKFSTCREIFASRGSGDDGHADRTARTRSGIQGQWGSGRFTQRRVCSDNQAKDAAQVLASGWGDRPYIA